MIKSPVHEADLQEAGNSSLDQDHQGNKLTSTSSTKPNNLSPSPTPWLKLKDPRIVRVSRAFGGKDRHSKVCTIRGLRDRRVRLSVPTAIQLYDLQERLGLNQPSKVIDWLLDAAKHEIDELPPLPMPPSGAGFGVHHPSLVLSSSHDEQNDAHARMSRKNEEGEAGSSAIPRPDFWSTNPEGIWREKLKETTKETANGEEEEGHQKDDIGKSIGSDQKQLSNNFLTRISTNQHSFFPGLANNPNIPYGYQNWEQPGQSSNFQLPHHLAGSHGFGPQATELHNFNVLPSTLSLLTTQSYFPSHNAGATGEIDPRQFNHIQMLSSSNSISPTLYPNSQTLRGVPHLSMMTNNLANSSNNPGNGHHHHQQQQEQPNEDQESPSR